MRALAPVCAKTFAMSLAFLGLLMAFTWAEEDMLLLCQAMLVVGAASALLHAGSRARRAERPGRAPVPGVRGSSA